MPAPGELRDQMSFMHIVLQQTKSQTTDGTGMKIKEKINPSVTLSLVQTNWKKKGGISAQANSLSCQRN